MSFILRALLSFSREEGRRLTRAAAQAGLAGLSTWVLTAFWTGALPAPTPLTLVLAARWPPTLTAQGTALADDGVYKRPAEA